MNIEYTYSKTYANSKLLFGMTKWNYVYTNYLRSFTESINFNIIGTYKTVNTRMLEHYYFCEEKKY